MAKKSKVFEDADRIFAEMQKHSPDLLDGQSRVTYSTNAAGSSAYISTRYGDVRISDHYANSNYRPGQIADIPAGSSASDSRQIASGIRKGLQRHEIKKVAAAAHDKAYAGWQAALKKDVADRKKIVSAAENAAGRKFSAEERRAAIVAAMNDGQIRPRKELDALKPAERQSFIRKWVSERMGPRSEPGATGIPKAEAMGSQVIAETAKPSVAGEAKSVKPLADPGIRKAEKQLAAARKTQKKVASLEAKLAEASKNARAAEKRLADHRAQMGDTRINRDGPKPRTPFESPPKGATDGRLRTDRKPTTRPGPAAKPKTPANAAAALDAVTRDAKQVVATERAIKKDASLNTNAVRERTRPTTAKTKAPTVAELKAQAKAQGLKGYSKMTKAQLSQALGNGPAGWSDAAREASAKVRGGNAAPAAAKSAGGTMKALGKVAKAASKGAKVLLPAVAGMAALSAFNESAQAGESTATATGKAVKAGGTTAADMLTGGALTHYDNARAKGISKTSSTIGAIMKGAASVASLGLADLATWAAGSRPTMKAPDVRKASAKQQAIYAAKAKKESAMTAGRKAQPAAKPEGPTGMVAAHRKRVNGKTVSVEARRMTAKEIRARAM